MVQLRSRQLTCPACNSLQVYKPRKERSQGKRQRAKCKVCRYMIEVPEITVTPRDRFTETQQRNATNNINENSLRGLLQRQGMVCILDIMQNLGMNYTKAYRFLLKCERNVIVKRVSNRRLPLRSRVVFWEQCNNEIAINDNAGEERVHGNYCIKFPIEYDPGTFVTSREHRMTNWIGYYIDIGQWTVEKTPSNLIFRNKNHLGFPDDETRIRWERSIITLLYNNEIRFFIELGFEINPDAILTPIEIGDNRLVTEASTRNTRIQIPNNYVEDGSDSYLVADESPDEREFDYMNTDSLAQMMANSRRIQPLERRVANLEQNERYSLNKITFFQNDINEIKNNNANNNVTMTEIVSEHEDLKRICFETIKFTKETVKTLNNRRYWGLL